MRRSTETRVLLLNNSLAMGGIETMILDFARAAQQGLFEASVGVLEPGGSLESQVRNLVGKVHHIPNRSGIDPMTAVRLWKLCRREKIEVLHSHNYASWFYAGLAMRFGAASRHIHTEHSGVEPSPKRFMAERMLAAKTDAVVAVSKDVKRYMVETVGIADNRIQVVYNGVNTSRFKFNSDARARIRSELQLADADVVAGVVARLEPIKAHAYLLDSMSIVQRTNPNVRLLVVGNGGLRNVLEDKVKTFGLSNAVFFLGERQDIPEILSALDFYVLPSENEGMNLSLLEAMSVGLPVVARNVGGNSEIVRHGETGFLVPGNGEDAFAESLLRIAGDAETRRRMGTAGNRRVLSFFDQARTVDTYRALYSGESR
jgi:glycosyltransferase involved in cell wall biosynthesis